MHTYTTNILRPVTPSSYLYLFYFLVQRKLSQLSLSPRVSVFPSEKKKFGVSFLTEMISPSPQSSFEKKLMDNV